MNTRQTVTHLPVQTLTAHPSNIRDNLGDLTELALSIREHGILQPLTVTEAPCNTEGRRFLLIAGHRRLAAACLAGHTRVPAVIRHNVADEGAQLVLMLVENCQRRDLNPIEKAEAFDALRNRGLTQTQIGRRVGVTAGTVSHYLTLLDLPEDEREELRQGVYTTGEAVASARALRAKSRQEDTDAPRRPRGRPKGRKTTPWFGDKHPLAKVVRALCDHRGRPKVGGIACGPCWEQVIREDDRPNLVESNHDSPDVDEVAVERRATGDHGVRLGIAERNEAVRTLHRGGVQ